MSTGTARQGRFFVWVFGVLTFIFGPTFVGLWLGERFELRWIQYLGLGWCALVFLLLILIGWCGAPLSRR